MIRKLIQIQLLFMSILAATAGYAVQVNGLYRAEIPVTSQSAQERKSAIQQALQQVFIKVSGDSSIVKLDSVLNALSDPDHYLQSYNYLNGQRPNADPGDVGGYFLQAQFSAKAINQLLLDHNQTLWGRNRPLLLVWLAIQNGPGSKLELVSSAREGQNQAQNYFIADAKSRGLPTLFPLYDLTDMQHVSANDILNANTQAIAQASKRYGSDSILTGSIQQGVEPDSSWRAHWILLSQGNRTVWDNTAGTLKDLISSGIDAVTDTLAVRYGVAATQGNSEEGHLQLTVLNVQNLANYAKVSHYLERLTPVKQVEVVQIVPSSIIYDIKVVGGRFGFMQALSLDHRLKRVTDQDNDESPNNHTNNHTNNSMDRGLVYRWIS